jgi:adenosylcobyric acid synthase
MISGYIINKFRGDVSLFADGIKSVHDFTGWPCFGVVPWLKAAGRLPAEDSVVLERLVRGTSRALKVVVPVLPRIANFDDLDPLLAEPDVDVVFVRAGERLPTDAALVVLPGSKSTIGDLNDLRAQGWDRDIAQHVKRGGRVIGICGGYQMLGRMVHDPLGIEGTVQATPGLGLLDVETKMAPEKTVRNSRAWSTEHEVDLEGYEIHLGVTRGADCSRPSAVIDGRADGAVSPDGRIMGTYLHGLFTSDAYRAGLLASFGIAGERMNYRESVDAALDEVAGELEAVLDKTWLDRLLAV